ncbi:MAG: hypothetical protein L3J88_13475 [Gammaproteobacteria bacterium]|nr:hypothetical protein [Gammaproteobacteria bacterium]MCF6364324.1 hypothetical protein [Gammaproteobacteria bacterium]
MKIHDGSPDDPALFVAGIVANNARKSDIQRQAMTKPYSTAHWASSSTPASPQLLAWAVLPKWERAMPAMVSPFATDAITEEIVGAASAAKEAGFIRG